MYLQRLYFRSRAREQATLYPALTVRIRDIIISSIPVRMHMTVLLLFRLDLSMHLRAEQETVRGTL